MVLNRELVRALLHGANREVGEAIARFEASAENPQVGDLILGAELRLERVLALFGFQGLSGERKAYDVADERYLLIVAGGQRCSDYQLCERFTWAFWGNRTLATDGLTWLAHMALVEKWRSKLRQQGRVNAAGFFDTLTTEFPSDVAIAGYRKEIGTQIRQLLSAGDLDILARIPREEPLAVNFDVLVKQLGADSEDRLGTMIRAHLAYMEFRTRNLTLSEFGILTLETPPA